MLIESVMPSNNLILCHLLLLPSLFPCIRVFSNESALHIRWPKYLSFSISPFNELSGLISFRIDCFDLLIVQGTLKSLLQNRNWKAESMSSLALSLLYGPALTFVHDSWKNQSFEQMDLHRMLSSWSLMPESAHCLKMALVISFFTVLTYELMLYQH